MFAKWFEKPAYPIGIDFGAYSIKMVQLRSPESGTEGAENLEIQARAERSVPENLPVSGPERVAAVTRLLNEMRASGPFLGNRVVCSLPTSAIQFKNLRLPKMPPNELQAAVEWEAADRLGQAGHDAGEEVYLQFFDAGEVRQGEDLREEIILMAAPSSVVHTYLDALTGAGFEPAAMECAPAAMERCVSRNRAPNLDAPADVILDVGYGSSKVLIARANHIVFFKSIDVGGRTFDGLVAQRLNISPADAAEVRRKAILGASEPKAADASGTETPVEHAVFDAIRPAVVEVAREVSLCLRYYSVTFRGRRPETGMIVGGEGRCPQFIKLLSDEVGLNVTPARGVGRLDGQWLVAAGLSMRRETLGARTRGATAIAPAKGQGAAA